MEVDPTLIQLGPFLYTAGHMGITALLTIDRVPSAIFEFSDELAPTGAPPHSRARF